MKFTLKLLLLFCVFTSARLAIAQTSTGGVLITGRSLKWSDFTGTPDNASPFSAMTYWDVSYNYVVHSYNNDTVVLALQVTPSLKSSSWVKKDQASPPLLQHEQGHYDLAILCAETFKSTVAASVFLRNNYQAKMDSIFKATLSLFTNIELQYDDETNHMKNTAAQAEWNKNIADLLKKTSSGR